MSDEVEGTYTEVPEPPRNGPGASESALVAHSPERALVPAQPGQALVSSGDPSIMIDLATRLATALADIVERQKLYSVISGKKYPQVEAWMTIGRLDNVVARESSKPVRYDDGSYEAEVELVRLSDGMIIGRSSAVCGMKGDNPWSTRPEHNRRSMAVTRATSRAFRQQYSWIMALAGYEPTPADEMPETDTAASSVPAAAAQRPQRAAAPRRTATPVSGHISLTGEVTKVADGIRRDTDGVASYDVTFKADGKTYHAMTSGEMAEKVVREVKPSVGDPISVEGRYFERDWEKNGEKMTGTKAVKEVHDISRIVIRDEVVLGGETADPPNGTTTGRMDPTETSSDFTDEASVTFEDMALKFGEVGFKLAHEAIVVTAERKERPRTPGAFVVVGTAQAFDGEFRYLTDHDFDPPPALGDKITFRGEFVRAPDGEPVALGAIS